MPGNPAYHVDEIETSNGKLLTVSYALQTGEVTYSVSYSDLGINTANPDLAKRMLDGGRDQMVAGDKTLKLVAEKELALGDYLGREWLIQEPAIVSLRRAYMVSGRMYQIVIAIPLTMAFKKANSSANPEDRTDLFRMAASSFLDSFRLTEGEVDRVLREIREQKKDVIVVTVTDSSAQSANSADIINGRVLHLVQPAYPDIARRAHASGSVSVLVLIDLEGKVIAAQVVDGHPLLRPAAIKAARDTEFSPTQLNGKPVMVAGVIIYNFVAQ